MTEQPRGRQVDRGEAIRIARSILETAERERSGSVADEAELASDGKQELWAYGIENDISETWMVCGIASSREAAIERVTEQWGTHYWIAPFELDAPPLHCGCDRAEYWSVESERPK